MKKRVRRFLKKLKGIQLKHIIILVVPLLFVMAIIINIAVKKNIERNSVTITLTDMPSVAADEVRLKETTGYVEETTEIDTSESTEMEVIISTTDSAALESGSAVSDANGSIAYALIYCWIRSGNTDRSSKVGELYYGDEVVVLEIGEDYTKIKTDEDTGYVKNIFISSTKPVWVGNIFNTHKINMSIMATASAKYELENFTYYSQLPDMPAGCEITSLAMVLNYLGVKCDKEMLVNYLETGEKGDNYFSKYIGNVFEEGSYGCYADALCNCAQSYLSSRGISSLIVGNISGTDVDSLLGLVATGHPVIVWATEDMKSVGDNNIIWTYEGQPMGYLRGEHCLVLVGFDKENDKVLMADPMKGCACEYSLSAFRLRYKAQFSQAVLIY